MDIGHSNEICSNLNLIPSILNVSFSFLIFVCSDSNGHTIQKRIIIEIEDIEKKKK